MARRSRDWNEDLAKDLKDPVFAREFIRALLDEGFGLREALGRSIRAFGVKEFARKAGISSSNVLRAVDPEHNPTEKMLERILKPFGLRLTVAPKTAKPGGKAA
jgi:DNA-binding phage protein